MSVPDALAALPDEAMVPVGWVKAQLAKTATEETPAVDDAGSVLVEMWVREATRNLCRTAEWDESGSSGATPRGGRG